MKKLLPLTVILVLWAASAVGNKAPALPGNPFSMPVYRLEMGDQPEKDIEIYPNPVTEGRLTITTTESILTVQILNITGKMVFSQEYQPNTSSVVVELDKMEKGIYLVRVGFTDKTSYTEKIMIK